MLAAARTAGSFRCRRRRCRARSATRAPTVCRADSRRRDAEADAPGTRRSPLAGALTSLGRPADRLRRLSRTPDLNDDATAPGPLLNAARTVASMQLDRNLLGQ